MIRRQPHCLDVILQRRAYGRGLLFTATTAAVAYRLGVKRSTAIVVGEPAAVPAGTGPFCSLRLLAKRDDLKSGRKRIIQRRG